MNNRLATADDLAEFNAKYPSDSEAMARVRKALTEHTQAKRRLPDGTVEKTREELEAEIERLSDENERIWHIVEEMRMTWKPAEHCDSCAHLQMELGQHKTVRKHYLAENQRLCSVLDRIAGATMSQYASIDDMARDIKRKAREALRNDTQENNGR